MNEKLYVWMKDKTYWKKYKSNRQWKEEWELVRKKQINKDLNEINKKRLEMRIKQVNG